MTRPLIHVVRDRWPDADMVWLGEWAEQSAVVRHTAPGDLVEGGGVIVVTVSPDAGPLGEHDPVVYWFCIYPDDTYDLGGEPIADLDIRGADNVATLIDDLTRPGMQPEGTDWGAWAELRISDWLADGVIEGAVES